MGTRAVGYFREGTDGRDAQPTPSVAEQNHRFLQYCNDHGYDVAATFLDRGAGGDRPGFSQLLDYLRRRSGDIVVVVDSIDRLGLDARQSAHSFAQIVGLGAQVTCMTGQGDDAAAMLLQQWSAREASERTGERVRAAMRRKAVKGEVLGRPPYGYRVGLRHRLELIPDEAAVVRYIFRLYLQENLGIRLIARRLNEEGYRTRKGGNWSMITIRDILRNRAYLGTYARFGVRVAGSHQAIVNGDDFKRAQERMAARRTGGGPRNPSQFLLSGLLYCGACGSRMIGVSRRQSWTRRSDGGTSTAEYRYYQCGSRTNQSVCDYHTRRADELDEEVRRAALRALDGALSGLPVLEEHPHADQAEAQRLRTRLKTLERELDKVMDQAAAGLISREKLRAASVEFAQRQLEIEGQLAEIERRSREHDDLGEQRAAWAAARDHLQDDWDSLSFDDRQSLLRDVLERVSLHQGRIEPALRA